MLPKFNTDQEKKAFAQKLYDLFSQDPRVTNMLKTDGEASLFKQWPWNSVDAELKRTEGKKLIQDNGNQNPCEQMGDMMHAAFDLLVATENIIHNDNLNDNEMRRWMDNIGSAMNLFQNPNLCEPLSTMKNYLDGYGKGATGSPIMNFFMGISQTINNVVLTNNMVVQEFAAISDKIEEDRLSANQTELEPEENELAQMCAEAGIEPDQIQSEYNRSKAAFNKAQEELNNRTKNIANATKQIKGIDPEKLMTDINALEKKQADLNLQKTTMGMEIASLETTFDKKGEERIRRGSSHKLEDFTKKRTEIDDNQQTLDKRSKKSNDLIAEATPKVEKLEEELKQYTSQHPELEELTSKYDKLIEKADRLNAAIGEINDVFYRTRPEDLTINAFMQGRLSGDKLNYNSQSKVSEYLNAKEFIINELKDDLGKDKVSEMFTQAEQSDRMSIGAALQKNDGLLKTSLQETEQASQKLADSNPTFQKVVELKNAIRSQKNIISTQKNVLENCKNEQKMLDNKKDLLETEELEFKKKHIQKMEDNHALPKDITKEELMNKQPKEVIQTLKKALEAKKKESKEIKNELEKTSKELTSQKDMASKIKIAKESAPELLKLRANAQKAENDFAKFDAMQQKSVSINNKLVERENGINTLRVSNATKREEAVRTGFADTLKSLNQQVPTVKGEKNSDPYDNMRKGLNELLEKMKSSSYKAEDRAKDFGDLQKLAQKYLDEKNKQWRPFPTQKRKDRQRLAQDIVTFCENSKKLSAETPSVNPDVLHEAARQNPKVNPKMIAEQKFKDQMKPKVEAAKAKLQKNVSQPVNQTQKNQTTPNISQLG